MVGHRQNLVFPADTVSRPVYESKLSGREPHVAWPTIRCGIFQNELPEIGSKLSFPSPQMTTRRFGNGCEGNPGIQEGRLGSSQRR